MSLNHRVPELTRPHIRRPPSPSWRTPMSVRCGSAATESRLSSLGSKGSGRGNARARGEAAREPPLGLEQRRLGEDGAEDNRTLLLAQHARLVAGLEEALKRRGVGQRVNAAGGPRHVVPHRSRTKRARDPPGTNTRRPHGRIPPASVLLRASLFPRASSRPVTAPQSAHRLSLAVSASRSRSTSRIGGAPKSLLYSRLNCEASQ